LGLRCVSKEPAAPGTVTTEVLGAVAAMLPREPDLAPQAVRTTQPRDLSGNRRWWGAIEVEYGRQMPRWSHCCGGRSSRCRSCFLLFPPYAPLSVVCLFSFAR